MLKQKSVSLAKAENLLSARVKQRDLSRQYAVWAKRQLEDVKGDEPHSFTDGHSAWYAVKYHCEQVYKNAVRTKIENEKMVTLYRSIIIKATVEDAKSVVLPLELPPELENKNVKAEREGKQCFNSTTSQ